MFATDVIHALLPWIDGATVIGIVTGTAKTSEWLEGMLNDSGKAAITNWLKNVPEPDSESGPSVFSTLIDRVFGTRPFSFSFFGRSCIASLIAVFLVWIVSRRLILHFATHIVLNPMLTEAMGLVVWSLLINLCPDYVSLLVTRYIVRAIARKSTFTRLLRLFIADFTVTASISLFSTLFGILCFFEIWPSISALTLDRVHLSGLGGLIKFIFLFHWMTFRVLLDIFTFFIKERFDGYFVSIFFYSAFFTSIWLWIYIVSSIVIKGLHRMKALWKWLSKYLDIEKHPLFCVGKVSGIILGAIWAVFVTILHFGKSLHF
jgi:hypothetical protein